MYVCMYAITCATPPTFNWLLIGVRSNSSWLLNVSFVSSTAETTTLPVLDKVARGYLPPGQEKYQA